LQGAEWKKFRETGEMIRRDDIQRWLDQYEELIDFADDLYVHKVLTMTSHEYRKVFPAVTLDLMRIVRNTRIEQARP
jgi:hypothetical protein